MALFCILIYIISIAGCGCFFLRRWKINPLLMIPAGFLVGSMLMSGGLLLLVSIHRLNAIYVSILYSVVFVFGILGVYNGHKYLKEVKHFIRADVYSGKFRVILVIIILIGLLLYFASAYAPPRNGDAMRYHLAQVKDTVRHSGFVYRPYYHYNFPQYFHYLFTPVYMLVGGTGFQLSSFFYFFLVIFITLYLAFSTNQTKQLLLLAALIVFTPLCIRSASITGNDFATTFYCMLGLVIIMDFKRDDKIRNLLLAFLSCGFALGCKYQVVLYMPIYILATIFVTRDRWHGYKKYVIPLFLATIPFMVASPFFIRNFYYTGDPVWPLLQDLFKVNQDYLYRITQGYNNILKGNISFGSLTKSVFTVVMPQKSWIFPFIWLLWLGYYFVKSTSRWVYRTWVLLYLGFWFLLQPNMYPRFVIYIFPVIAIMSIGFYERFSKKSLLLGKLAYLMIALSIIFGMGFAIWYSLDSIEYQFTRDLKKYHEATWFYEQYQWINREVGDDGRILVIVNSGHTYYLDKDYIRADPWLTGTIDWMAIRNTEELKSVLQKLEIRYIFYHDMNWNKNPSEQKMMRLIHELKEEDGTSTLLDEHNLKLITQRVLGRYCTTRAFLLDLGNTI